MGKLTSNIEISLTYWALADCHSCPKENADSIVDLPLVQTSNGDIDTQSGISTLPVELLLLIFHHCDSAIRPRLNLTHTCHRWRLIAVSSPSLWTNLHIELRNTATETRYNNFESLLSMQVDRSGGLPLDVVWISEMTDPSATQALLSVRDKASFSRWRSLELCMAKRCPHVESLLAPITTFKNLESLVISSSTEMGIVHIFCRTAMPKLQILDLRASNDVRWQERARRWRDELSLPDSVITLHAGIREWHDFPNILNYNLKYCSFKASTPINLRSMTSLMIGHCLTVRSGCDVLLPALRYLRLPTISMYPGARIEAPVLQILHLVASLDPNDPLDPRYTDEPPGYLYGSVNSSGYRLSPKKLIILELYLPKRTIIGLLRKSRELTQATICFNNRESAREVVEELYGPITGTTPLNGYLCPQLEDLTLECGWDAFDMPLSAEKWLIGLKARKESLPRARVSIMTRRKGEERYQPLSGW